MHNYTIPYDVATIATTVIIFLLWGLSWFWLGRRPNRQAWIAAHRTGILRGEDTLAEERRRHREAERAWEEKVSATKLRATEEALEIGRGQGRQEAIEEVTGLIVAFLREQADFIEERRLGSTKLEITDEDLDADDSVL